MNRSAKIFLTWLGLVISILFVFAVGTWLENRSLERKVRIAFGLSSEPITIEAVRNAARRTFPDGTPEAKVRESLTQAFGAKAVRTYELHSRSGYRLLHCAFTSELGWSYADLMWVEVVLDESSTVRGVTVRCWHHPRFVPWKMR